MTNPDLERGLAAHLQAVLGPDRIVRRAVSAEPLPMLDQYALVSVMDTEQECEGLWVATAACVGVTPSSHEDASPDEHSDFVRGISSALADHRYAQLAAAMMQTTGYLVQGWWIEGSMDRFHEGRWVAGSIVRVGLEMGAWTRVSGLNLTALSGALPDAGAVGSGSLIDTRGGSSCTEDLPAGRYQLAVCLAGAMSVNGQPVTHYLRAWSTGGSGAAVPITVAPESLVSLSWAS